MAIFHTTPSPLDPATMMATSLFGSGRAPRRRRSFRNAPPAIRMHLRGVPMEVQKADMMRAKAKRERKAALWAAHLIATAEGKAFANFRIETGGYDPMTCPPEVFERWNAIKQRNAR
jgi:hypothetical protein